MGEGYAGAAGKAAPAPSLSDVRCECCPRAARRRRHRVDEDAAVAEDAAEPDGDADAEVASAVAQVPLRNSERVAAAIELHAIAVAVAIEGADASLRCHTIVIAIRPSIGGSVAAATAVL